MDCSVEWIEADRPSFESSNSDFLNEHLDFKEFYIEEKMTQDQHQIYRMIFMMSPGVILFLGKLDQEKSISQCNIKHFCICQ